VSEGQKIGGVYALLKEAGESPDCWLIKDTSDITILKVAFQLEDIPQDLPS
jgi:hypothetical protein